jgi:hypothetical protein
MSDDYQRIELITGRGSPAALDDRTEASDHRGELPAWGDRIVGRPPARRCAGSGPGSCKAAGDYKYV